MGLTSGNGADVYGHRMKVLLIHNKYRFRGGEETVFDATAALLKSRGVHVSTLQRDSRASERSLFRKACAFVSGIYSPSMYGFISSLIMQEKPDIVQVHNLYPLFSPSVLVACHRTGVPAVMVCHNYRLTCPAGGHLSGGNICERCIGGREHWCILRNCTGEILKSVAYALRSYTARQLQLFHKNVTLFIALSEFAKARLVDNGFEYDRIVVLPNMISVRHSPVDPLGGRYIAFAGRISPEKGLDTLLAAAAQLPDIPLRLAGEGPIMSRLVRCATPNVEFMGHLRRPDMSAFYRSARFLVLPSKWFEGCPMVISEAMSYGLPVVASRIGGLPELVEDGVTGLLFEPGNIEELACKMKLLWEDGELCQKMGRKGREKAIRDYGEGVYYDRLMTTFERAMSLA
jgi:glycosyltransferase involved in cell wall biosynthesis